MGSAYQIGPWQVLPSRNSISLNGKNTRLEPKVMGVLVCLADRAEETVPKDHLLKSVWPDTFVTDDVLTRAISELRRVFQDDPRESRVIQTISKRGYRLVAPVKRLNEMPAVGISASPVAGSEVQKVGAQTTRLRMLFLSAGAGVLLMGLLTASISRWIRGRQGWNKEP